MSSGDRKPPYVPTANDLAAQKLFDSLGEAQAVTPDADDYKVYRVRATKDFAVQEGDEFFTHNNGPVNARMAFLKEAGLVCELAESPRVREVVRVKPVDSLTAEELEAEEKRIKEELKRRRKMAPPSSAASKGAAAPSEEAGTEAA